MPSQEVYRCALDAAKGTEIWRAQSPDISPQGYLLATPTRLFVPTGRTTPALFDRETGRKYGQAQGNGGAYAVVIDDAIVSGPGRRTGTELTMSSSTSSENIAQFPGVRIVVSGEMAYLQATDKISALNRTRYVALSRERNEYNEPRKELEERVKAAKSAGGAGFPALEADLAAMDKAIAELTGQMDACYLWEHDVDDPYAMILAGNSLFVGGEGIVRAFNAADGAELWKEKVGGRAYGLAVANGHLLVSTDAGTIHCFRATQVDRERVVMLPTNPAPYPEDKWTGAYAAAAETILAQANPGNGYCLVLGCGEGRLAYELARRSAMQIVGVERDEKKVAAARAALDTAGLYGTRVTVHQWKDDILPYTSYFANLVVSEEALVSDKLSTASSEVYRLLRPYGGTACIGGPKMARKKLEKWAAGTKADLRWAGDGDGAWAVLTRGEVVGSGEWTQLYADANHTANSKDPIRGPMAVQWFGAPGPRDMIDRHHRPMSSLFKHGRLFIPANDMIMTVDGYNGTPLWTLEVPNSRRIGALKNSGQMLVTDEYVYIATEGDCWAVDVEKGVRAFAIQAPTPDNAEHDWGYLNCAGDRLFGTGQARGASFNQLDWETCDLLEGDHRPVMMSQYLFSTDRYTGKKRWVYKNGAILNDGITIDGDSEDGCIYFFESRNEKSVTDEDGRTKLITFFGEEAYLVALRLKNGKKVWERPVDLPFHHIAYLNGANGVLLGCGTHNEGDQVFYSLHGFDMKTGKDVWQTRYRALDVRGKEYTGPGGSHGEQWQHPVIIGDTFYSVLSPSTCTPARRRTTSPTAAATAAAGSPVPPIISTDAATTPACTPSKPGKPRASSSRASHVPDAGSTSSRPAASSWCPSPVPDAPVPIPCRPRLPLFHSRHAPTVHRIRLVHSVKKAIPCDTVPGVESESRA